MDATSQQIVSAYEGGLTVEQLSEAFTEIDPISIKAALMQNSQVYRDSLHGTRPLPNAELPPSSEDINDEEFTLIKQATKQLALTSDNEEVRARMLKFLWNEKKGRNDTKQVKNLNINVNIFNDQIKRAKMAKEASKQLSTSRQEEISRLQLNNTKPLETIDV